MGNALYLPKELIKGNGHLKKMEIIHEIRHQNS